MAKAEDHSPNPKLDPDPPSNTEKDPDDWVSGGDPMTGAQASYLKTLCEDVGESFDPNLTKAAASKMIDDLRRRDPRLLLLLGWIAPMATAADFHPEVLRLFDRYVHGLIDRRDFLSGAARFAAASPATGGHRCVGLT